LKTLKVGKTKLATRIVKPF